MCIETPLIYVDIQDTSCSPCQTKTQKKDTKPVQRMFAAGDLTTAVTHTHSHNIFTIEPAIGNQATRHNWPDGIIITKIRTSDKWSTITAGVTGER